MIATKRLKSWSEEKRRSIIRLVRDPIPLPVVFTDHLSHLISCSRIKTKIMNLSWFSPVMKTAAWVKRHFLLRFWLQQLTMSLRIRISVWRIILLHIWTVVSSVACSRVIEHEQTEELSSPFIIDSVDDEQTSQNCGLCVDAGICKSCFPTNLRERRESVVHYNLGA